MTTDDNKPDVEAENSGSRDTMVIIVASIVGVLFLVVIAMVIRMVVNRKKITGIPQLHEVKTGVVDVEPQFVLAADDSKNIFGRSSTAPFGQDMIEGSENKKPGTGQNKRRKKNVLRKVKDPKSKNEERKEGDSDDDGFQNYDNAESPSKLSSPNNTASKFNASARSSGFSHDSVSTTRKLNNIALHRVNSDDE